MRGKRPARAAQLLGAAAVLAAWPASDVCAQDKASAPAAASKPSRDDEIVVVADPSQRSSIDRTTYVVRDNAEARSSNTLDLLRQLPTVEVTARDEIKLLGVPGVKIQIDGKDVPDPITMLRNLQGSQIAKIEVISNPSAQFSAQGTGGIINIVTRRNATQGLRGSATAEAGSYGAYALKLSPSWSHGKLSASGGLNVYHSAQRQEFERILDSMDASGVVTGESIERRHSRYDSDSLSANFLASYKPGAKQTISVTGWAGSGNGRDSGQSATSFSNDPAGSLEQSSAGHYSYDYQNLSADYKREGPREAESLAITTNWSRVHVQEQETYLTSGGRNESSFVTRGGRDNSTASLKLDYVLPFDKDRRLSFGGALDNSRQDSTLEEEGQLSSGTPLSLSSTVKGSWVQEAAYVTYQSKLLGGTLLAGLRLEGRRYHFSADVPIRALDRSHPFPSLHLERKLGKKITADLSYSRRVAWPDIMALDPRLRIYDASTGTIGNPDLRPEITDAFEAKGSGRFGKHNIDVTAFLRHTRDPWSWRGTLTDGNLFVTQQVNLGTRTSRGVAIAARGPIGRRFHYSLNFYLSDLSYSADLVAANGSNGGFQYGGSSQLDYRHGSDGHRGSDHVTVNIQYSGPTNDILSRSGSYLNGDASWSHGLTDHISAVLKAQSILGPSKFHTTYYSAAGRSYETYRSPGPTFKISLIYSLGGSLPTDNGPGGPGTSRP